MRSVASADLRFVLTPAGALASVQYDGGTSVVPQDGLSRLAYASTGFEWSEGVGEVLASRGGASLAVSSTPCGRSGALTVTRGERVVFTGSGDLAEVLSVAATWRKGAGE